MTQTIDFLVIFGTFRNSDEGNGFLRKPEVPKKGLELGGAKYAVRPENTVTKYYMWESSAGKVIAIHWTCPYEQFYLKVSKICKSTGAKLLQP